MKKKIMITAVLLITASMLVLGQSYKGKNKNNYTNKLNEEYCNGMFKSSDGTIIDLLNENQSASGYLNVLDWLQGRVPGLQVYTLRNGTKIPYIRGSRASIFVDEALVDAGYLNALPVSDIAIIKIFKTPFAGSIGNNGAVAIYTIKPEEEEDEPDGESGE